VPDPIHTEEYREKQWAALSSLVAAVGLTSFKIVVGALTGSLGILAEAAHSWADAGNEVFLLIASRRSRRPADLAHPFGHGREAYVWSLFGALGVFVAGAAVSVEHGIGELITPEKAGHFVIGYAVLAVSFVLEGTSFLQSVRQARPEAASLHRDLIGYVLATSDPTLRAVFAEDSAALAGLVIAAAGLPAPGAAAQRQAGDEPRPGRAEASRAGQVQAGEIPAEALGRRDPYLGQKCPP